MNLFFLVRNDVKYVFLKVTIFQYFIPGGERVPHCRLKVSNELTLPLLYVQSDCVLFCLPCLFLFGYLHVCTIKGRKRPYLICTLL